MENKTFAVINGKELYIVKKPDIKLAIQWAQNVCDHSKEIIVREVTNLETNNNE
jgi:hypothetical protein